jgi:ABC-type Fe3+-hydroxamate transport system substrate-binding protein
VGVTQYCVHPRSAFDHLPRLGGTKDADAEAIARLAPDLVIANQEENTARVVRTLADGGIDVWVTYPRTVGEGVGLLEDIGRLGATSDATSKFIEPVRRAFDAADDARRRNAGSRPRVFCPIWRDPWMTINRDTYIHDLIELCGGENLFAGPLVEDTPDEGEAADPRQARRYPLLDLDEWAKAQPEVILLPDEPYAFDSSDRAMIAELDLPAARNGRIHLIDGTLVSWDGPRIAESIRILAGLFAN